MKINMIYFQIDLFDESESRRKEYGYDIHDAN